MGRSGNEPDQARSALTLRLGLALFGLVTSGVGAVLLAAADHAWPAAAFGVVAGVAAVDAVVVARHIRAGAHYQPGREVPAYRPVDHATPAPPRRDVPQEARRREYLTLMATCIALLLIAWVGLRLVSTLAAVLVTGVALLIPPVATWLANSRRRPGRRD